MSISISTADPLYFAALFGVDKALIEKAKACQVSVTQSSIGFLTVVSAAGNHGQVTVKGSAITLAKSGTLGPASKDVIRHQLEQLMVKAINASKVEFSAKMSATPVVVNTVPQPGKPVALTSKEKQAFIDSLANDEQLKQGLSMVYVPPLPSTGKVPASAVKLSSANTLGQPVTGTSASSTYYLVARFSGCNVAIRRTKSKLSIRAEGSKLNDYKGSLQSLGINIKGDYASQHFEVSDELLLRKTVGALIGSMGLSSLLEAMDPSNIPVKV